MPENIYDIHLNNKSTIFESIDKKHRISINILDDIAWFNILDLDYENCKTFLILLKRLLEYLNSSNVKIIKQYIYEEDLKYFEKSSYLDIGDGKYLITTEIANFLPDLINVLGINKL